MKIITIMLLGLVAACNITTNNAPTIIKGDNGMNYKLLGKDKTGCNYYNSLAPGMVTLTVIYYRKADGSFTNIKSQADCG